MRNLLVKVCLLFIMYPALSQTDDFRLCEPGRKFGGIVLQSYHVNTHLEGGLRKIKKHFFEKYQPHSNSDDTGYLTLRFMVNCKGAIGMIEVLGCTRDFKKKIFSDHSVSQLSKLLLELNEWVPGKTADGVNVDSQKFLTFIFEKGVLKDIVPK